ncbi:MAG: hypothetical protein WKF87_18225 [Chryseolinea sp.]
MNKKDQLFEQTLRFWPRHIDISDGKFIDETGFESGNLTKAWGLAEQKSKREDWQELSVWIFYKMLHKKAMESFSLGHFEVHVADLNRIIFSDLLLENLQHNGYEDMLRELIR